jgi:hypothetical protein
MNGFFAKIGHFFAKIGKNWRLLMLFEQKLARNDAFFIPF